MGERGHTKGPWEIRSSEIGDGACIYTPDGYGIGKAWDLNGRPENAANARLIAAAPDLYRELDMQVRNCPLCKGDGETDQSAEHIFRLDGHRPGVKTPCPRCRSARLALSKAPPTGEASDV